MIDQQMVPGGRIVEEQHGADMGDLHIVRLRPFDGALAVHRVAFGLLDQRHARHAELAALVHGELAGKTGTLAALPVLGG